MLGKLFKYEWKGFRFPLLVMLIVLIGTTILTCGIILSIDPKYDDAVVGFSVMSLVFSILLYYFGIIGCSLGVILIIAIRFYKTCYSDQGYLTHTLPVSTQKLLNVKIISSFVMILLTTLAAMVTMIIIINVGMNHIISIAIAEGNEYYTVEEARREIYIQISRFFGEFRDEFGVSLGWYAVYMIVYFIIAMLSNVITILGCISLGQLYAKHRVIGAILAYIAVQFIMQTMAYFANIPMYGRMMRMSMHTEQYTPFKIMSPTLNITLVITVLMAVLMYFVNLYMMTRKLNLE